MKKKIFINLLLIFSSASLFAQKTISEGIISYNISIQDSGKAATRLDSAVTIVYLKGDLSRTDMINSLGSETTIFDAKNDKAVILKQYNGQKLMITLTKENWNDKYDKYNGILFQPTADTKKIGGYDCKKVIAHLKNGTTFYVYYASDITIVNKEYNPIFKDLPGLPVQYEFTDGKFSFLYTISAVNLSPLPAARFDVPKSGYRIMTYSENKKEIKL
jgi:GLPGLI family protein